MKLSAVMYQRCEIVLHSTKTYENPFLDVNIDAIFTHEDGTRVTLPGFWNGENEWKVRFSAEKPGLWRYRITCTDQKNLDLYDEGEITAVPCQNPATELEKHGYVQLAKDKRYLTYADGTPFFYLGDTHWMMPDYERMHECNYPGCTCGNQFKHVVDDRKKKGFTVYQTYFASARYQMSKSGVPGWWTDNTYTMINPTAFNEGMDVMMEYLASQGFTVALGFGTHYATIRSYHNVAEPVLAFVRYCVARYACYPLMWITAQEITTAYDNAFEIWRQVGQRVSELDGYHRPNGAHMHVHDLTDNRTKLLDTQPWHEWWTIQAGHGGVSHLHSRSFYQSFYENSTKPFLETESQYEDIYCGGFCGHDAPRQSAWLAVQCGAAGYTYGVTGLWAMSWDMKKDPGYASYNPEAWYHGVEKMGSWQMGYLRAFYEYVGWYRMIPSFDFTYGNFEVRKQVAISHDAEDNTLIFYFFNPEPENGWLAHLKKNVKYQAHWFDPVNGKFIDLPDIITEDGTYPVPERPNLRDWVLLLNAEDLGPYETENYVRPGRPIAADEAKPGKEYPLSLWVSSEDDDFPAANMVDGKPDTYWKAYAPYTSQTIIADLGESKDLGYLHLESNLPDGRFIEFRIDASNDREHWDPLVERMGPQVMVGGRFPRFFEPLRGSYRYVRFFLNAVPLYAPFKTQLEVTKFAIYGKEE